MNTRRITLTVCSVLMLLIPAACSQAPRTNSKTISIEAGDAGKTITLKKGDTLVVRLNGNPTTGYNWLTQTMDPANLKQVGEPAYTPGSSQLGTPGKITLKFQAVKTGKTKLTLSYMRSFERDTAPLNTFEVTVVVT